MGQKQLSLSVWLCGPSTISHYIHAQNDGFPLKNYYFPWSRMLTPRGALNTFQTLASVSWESFSGSMFQCWHLCIIFIQTVQHNVLVKHYGIRRLHSNTLRVSFPSRDILLGRVLLGRAVCLSRHSEELTRQKGREKALDWDPHTQSLTLIINYGCFCFFLPQPLTTQLLAVRGGEKGKESERERRKGNFHQKELSIKTSEMNVPWSQRASWKRCGQMKIYMCLIGRGWVARDN